MVRKTTFLYIRYVPCIYIQKLHKLLDAGSLRSGDKTAQQGDYMPAAWELEEDVIMSTHFFSYKNKELYIRIVYIMYISLLASIFHTVFIKT